jgi:hypothetical protein
MVPSMCLLKFRMLVWRVLGRLLCAPCLEGVGVDGAELEWMFRLAAGPFRAKGRSPLRSPSACLRVGVATV